MTHSGQQERLHEGLLAEGAGPVGEAAFGLTIVGTDGLEIVLFILVLVLAAHLDVLELEGEQFRLLTFPGIETIKLPKGSRFSFGSPKFLFNFAPNIELISMLLPHRCCCWDCFIEISSRSDKL